MNTTNLAQQLAAIETTSGLDLLVDYVSWIELDGLPVVVARSGKRKSVLKKYQRVYKVLGGCQVVCVWGLFIGICRSGRGRPQPFG